MSSFPGELKDKRGNRLMPITSADCVRVSGSNGDEQPLSVVLADLGLSLARVTEDTFVLESALDPGDRYQVSAYTVGNRRIQVWLDGVYAPGGESGIWQEYGTSGEVSDVILVNGNIASGVAVTIRVVG